MNLRIAESKQFRGAYTVNEIERQFKNCPILYCHIGCDNVAIPMEYLEDELDKKVYIVNRTESQRTPVIEQYMDIRMGRMPKQTIEHNRSYKVEAYPKEYAMNRRFKVYEIDKRFMPPKQHKQTMEERDDR